MCDLLAPLEVARIVDRFRDQHLRGESDWKPLEGAVSAAWCGGFMWMNLITQGGTVIELYKHRITRRYLNLDRSLVSRPGFGWPLMNSILWIRELSCG